MDGNVSLRADGGVCGNWLGVQCAISLNDGDGDCDHRRDLYFYLAGDGIALGPAGMGSLVGLGRAAYFDANPAVPLYRIHFAAIIHRRLASRRSSGCRAGVSRCRQRSRNLFFGAVVEQLAPGRDDYEKQLQDGAVNGRSDVDFVGSMLALFNCRGSGPRALHNSGKRAGGSVAGGSNSLTTI